jgi:hypothetical protein
VTSFGLEFPRFFEFKLNANVTDYQTTDLVWSCQNLVLFPIRRIFNKWKNKFQSM